jgi:hypothetical protein
MYRIIPCSHIIEVVVSPLINHTFSMFLWQAAINASFSQVTEYWRDMGKLSRFDFHLVPRYFWVFLGYILPIVQEADGVASYHPDPSRKGIFVG